MTPEAIAWSIGALGLLAIGLWPVLRSRRADTPTGTRDEAESLISQLNFELDQRGATVSATARRRAEQCALLAGAALAGAATPAACRRSQEWARSGLKALAK